MITSDSVVAMDGVGGGGATASSGGGGGLMDEFQLMKNQKYRVYVGNVDKALKNFEYSSEWADLISALGKLNKVSEMR